MSNRINVGLRALAGIAAVLIFGLLINLVVSQLRDRSVAANVTVTPDSLMPVSPQAGNRLLAFTMEEDGNFDTYTIHADGSGLTNLTNDPARDVNPVWSPDGRRIAFESDRTGFMQIYLMDADGSNVVQLTDDEADHELTYSYNSSYSPWSPDGSKLIFSRRSPGEEKWLSFIMDIKKENEKLLISEPTNYSALSWAPDGRHIAFVSSDTQNREVLRIYVVDADGKNPIDITEPLEKNERLDNFRYDWSRGGQAIFFIAYKHISEGRDQWIAYEASLDGSRLVQKATSSTPMGDWWEGTSFITGFDTSTLTWLRSDGTYSTFKPLENCQLANDPKYGFIAKRSSNGNLVINVDCPNDDMWFYYANSDGTIIKQLFNSPISYRESILIDITWSSDDNFVAFNIAYPDKTHMYIMNISESLKDPSTQPLQITIGGGIVHYSFSWQPVLTEEVVDQKPTPEPTQISPNTGLIAFTSAVEDGNLDIYTMRPDGSDLTNLTDNSAHDVNPYWSPDGRRIAFESDRIGFMQIFVMDADSSNVIQVTDGESDHKFANLNPWSPDGSRLLFTEKAPGDENWMIYAVDVDGQNRISLAQLFSPYNFPSWAPDGQHVAFLVLKPQNGPQEREVFRIHVMDANGNNQTDTTKLLPVDEDLGGNYSWTSDGQSISFIASRYHYENGNGKSTLYQASLDGNSLTEIDHVTTHMVDWWNGTSLIQGFGNDALTWLRSDGTYSTLNAYKNCEVSDIQHGLNYKRSSNGNLLIGAGCANDDWWLHWVNPDGTVIQQLLNYPIHAQEGFIDFVWSPDGRYIVLNVASSDITYMYVLNVAEAMEDPAIRLEPIVIGSSRMAGSVNYNISWQPIP